MSRSSSRVRILWLGPLVLVLVVAWLWWRSSEPEAPSGDEASDGPADVRGRGPTLRRPPPRRPGLLDAPRASSRADAEAVAGALDGRVESWLDASAVPNAELTFAGGGSIHSVVTDADGQFSFVAPKPGTYRLMSVLAEGYQPYAPALGQGSLRYRSRPAERVGGATIVLMPRLHLRGDVLDEHERPVADATIRWLSEGTGESALADEDPEYRSDAAGRFEAEARPGRWLEATHDVAGVGRVEVDERALAVGAVTLRLSPDTPRAEGTIGGQVFDPEGEPIEGARVLASSGSGLPSTEAVTDEQGAFELFDLVEGYYRVEARHAPYAPVWASKVPTGSDAVKLTLAPGGSITGVVTTVSGDAVPGATVVALRHTGPLTRTMQAQATVYDVDGEFALEGLPPAVYDVVASAADHALARERGVEVAATPVDVELTMPPGGRISGRVVDARTGEAVALARVEVEGAMGAGASITPVRSSALSDDAGAYEIRGVEPGRRSIYAYARGYAPRALSGIEVEAGRAVESVEVALRPAEDAVGEAFDIVGIGVMVRVEGEALRIIETVEGGGAKRADLRADDRLIAIDGVPVADLLTFGEAVEALRGREGTEVTITVERGEQEPFKQAVVRSRIQG